MLVAETVELRLQRLEAEHGVTVFYACEAGSRAWGFESQDSDYDVRFLYAHRTEWYLSIAPGRDVIEELLGDGLDLSGWDLRKALGLLRKSNPPLLEWLRSPIVYHDRRDVTDIVRALLRACFSPIACFHHYLHMARGNYREYLVGEQVRLKKYFYVLRPLLACIWLERGLGTVPMEFGRLVEGVVEDTPLAGAIADLLARKRAGAELEWGPRIPEMSDYLDAQIERLSALEFPLPERCRRPSLDAAFRRILLALNGPGIEP
jgi:predicted nucleotidyltransferase